METLRDRERDKAGTRVSLKSLQQLPPARLSPEETFNSGPDSVYFYSGHITFWISFQFLNKLAVSCLRTCAGALPRTPSSPFYSFLLIFQVPA